LRLVKIGSPDDDPNQSTNPKCHLLIQALAGPGDHNVGYASKFPRGKDHEIDSHDRNGGRHRPPNTDSHEEGEGHQRSVVKGPRAADGGESHQGGEVAERRQYCCDDAEPKQPPTDAPQVLPERRGKKARLAGSGRGVKLRFRPWRKVNVSFPSAQRANLRSIRNLLSTPRAEHSGSSL